MKKYESPEIKTLGLNTNDICNSSGLVEEQYDVGRDPFKLDIENW